MYERKFAYNEGYFGKICGCSVYEWKTIFARAEVDVEHTGDTALV